MARGSVLGLVQWPASVDAQEQFGSTAWESAQAANL